MDGGLGVVLVGELNVFEVEGVRRGRGIVDRWWWR